jgi:3-oxoacyl-[acyl-carrier protein] reductase
VIELEGKVVLVTGGAGGIGAAIVRTMVQAGGETVLHEVVTTGGAMDLQRELGAGRCHLVAGDLADGAAVDSIWRAALAWRGRIDVLVNNAGIYEPAAVDDDRARWAASWHRTLEINLVAPGQLGREAIRHFRDRGGGIIINMASRAAFRGDDVDYMHYAASKAGLVAMTRTIARHFGRDNITAFAAAPGFVRTNLNAAFFREHDVRGGGSRYPPGRDRGAAGHRQHSCVPRLRPR